MTLSFKEYFLYNEDFKKSKTHTHFTDFPMFSIFFKNDQRSFFMKTLSETTDFQKPFINARNKIIKMGFSSMHSNVLFNDLSDDVNSNTGTKGGVAGFASNNGKYMSIDIKQIRDPAYLEKIIIHEWAHLWMYNNSYGFKKAVQKFYNSLLESGKSKFLSSEKDLDFAPFIINLELSEKLYTEFTTSFAKMISDTYLQALTYKNPTVDDYFKESAFSNKKENVESDIRSIVLSLISTINSYINNDESLSYDYLIAVRENKEELNKLISKITDIITDNLFEYVERSIDNDLSEYAYKHDRSTDSFSEIELGQIYNSMYDRTENNKNILIKKEDNYDKLYSHVFTDNGIDANNIFEMIMKKIHEIQIKNVQKETEKRLERTENLSGESFNEVREEIANLVQWTKSYGLSNDSEIWATAVEEFINLPIQYRKEILNLMQKKESRLLPNRRMRKQNKK
jgi:hypothetical protein